MNKYLEKIALRRIISEIAKGTVSKSLSALSRSGAIKSSETYAKGMAKGNENIAKKLGTQIKSPSTKFEKAYASFGGGYTGFVGQGGKSGLVFARKNKYLPMGASKNMHQGLIRHELFEVKDAQKLYNHPDRQIPEPQIEAVKETLKEHGFNRGHVEKHFQNYKSLKSDSFTQNHAPVGAHMTPGVLAHESEMIRKNPYLSKLKEFRLNTGEAETVSKITGKKFGEDKMVGKDLKKAFNHKGFNPVDNGFTHRVHNTNVSHEELLRRFNSHE